MNSSDNFGLNLPEQTDSYDVEHMNENTRAIDTLLNERMALKTITVDTDLNRMLESGIYYLPQNNTYTNMPPSCTNGWLIVMKNDGNVKQVFLRRGSASTHSNAYSRLLSGTGDLIGDWVRYLTELELGAFTNLDLDPQATDVVQALNDLYSYCVNQFANKNHTHNYAGSSSAGGSATSAVKLQTARTIQTNLASTSSATFDGTANVTPGVTGVLPVANGGTGKDTLSDAYNALINSKNYDGNQTIYDEDRLTIEHNEIDNEFNVVRTSFACVWKYIKGCIASIFGLSESTLTTKNMEKSLIGSLDTDYTYYTSDNRNSCFLPSLEDTGSGRIIKKRPISSIIGLLGSVGSATRPVYFQYGYPVQCDYTLNKSVPSDAKFTDTTYGNATTSTAGLMSADDKKRLDKFYIQLLVTYPPVSSFNFTLPNGTYLLTLKHINYYFNSYWVGILSVHNGAGTILRINSNSFSNVTISGTTITVDGLLDRAYAIKICE